MASSKKTAAVTKDQIDSMIRTIRGIRVMLDSDLAAIYGVSTKRLNEQVKRNLERFPGDFMFSSPQKRAPFWGRKTRPQVPTVAVGHIPTPSPNTAP
jgi:hypothetical protein